MKYTIRVTQTTGEESIYELSIDGETYTAIDTAGYPIVLDGAIFLRDEDVVDLMVDFASDDDFNRYLDDIARRDGNVTDTISEIDDICSEGIRDYFHAILRAIED